MKLCPLFSSLIIIFNLMTFFCPFAESGSFEPYTRWGYDHFNQWNPTQIKLNPEVRVCWAAGTESFAKLTNKRAQAATAAIPYTLLKLAIQSKVNHEFTFERTGIHFVGWENCNSGKSFDAIIFITVSPQSYAFSGLSDVGEGAVHIGQRILKYSHTKQIYVHPKTKLYPVVTIKVSEVPLFDSMATSYIPRGSVDASISNMNRVVIHEFAHLAGMRHESFRPDRNNENEDIHCDGYRDGDYGEIEPKTVTNYYATPYDRYSISNYCWIVPYATNVFFKYKEVFTPDEAKLIEDPSVIKLTSQGYERTFGLSAGDVKTLQCFYKHLPSEWESICPNFNSFYKEIHEQQKLPVLSKIDCTSLTRSRQVITVGMRCQTTKGFEFVRVEDGWKDQENGITWFDEKFENFSHDDSMNKCKDKGRSLPTGWPERLNGKIGFPNYDSDFVVAEKHGIRDVIKDIRGVHWSSSVHPVYHAGAYVFSGWDGGNIFYQFDSPKKDYNDGALCVRH